MIIIPRQRIFSDAPVKFKGGRKSARKKLEEYAAEEAFLKSKLEDTKKLRETATANLTSANEGLLESSLKSKQKARAKNLELLNAQAAINSSEKQEKNLLDRIAQLNKDRDPVKRAARNNSQRVEDWVTENWKSGDKGKAKVALAAAGTTAAVGTGIYYGRKAWKKYQKKRRGEDQEIRDRLVTAYENSADSLMNQ